MKIPCFGPHPLPDRRKKGDHVMLDHFFDGVDPLHLESGFLPNDLHRLRRHLSEPGHRLAGKNLDLEPGAKPVVRIPHLSHDVSGISWDHSFSSAFDKIVPRGYFTSVVNPENPPRLGGGISFS